MIFMFTASWSFNNFQYEQRGRADDASFKGGRNVLVFFVNQNHDRTKSEDGSRKTEE